MRFFGGFGFNDDPGLFSETLDSLGLSNCGAYDVLGFSFGAQKALSFALDSPLRINRLILLSAAFFNDRDSHFAPAQLALFRRGKMGYMRQFLKKIGYAPEMEDFLGKANERDLAELLAFRFSAEDLAALRARGVLVLAIFGAADKIINVAHAAAFFAPFGIVYTIKNANHLLRIEP